MTDPDPKPSTPPVFPRRWVAFSRWVVRTPAVTWLLVAVLLVSAVAGYLFWYGSSILAAPWYLWLFVPDSPLAVTLMTAALVALHYGRRWEFLGLVASGACIKYGLWTDFVWVADHLSGGRYDWVAGLMSVTHLGMAVLGFVPAVFLRFRPVPLLLASLFFIANDVVDYVFGYHPPLPDPQDLGAISSFAVAMTAVVVCGWLVVAWWSDARQTRPPAYHRHLPGI